MLATLVALIAVAVPVGVVLGNEEAPAAPKPVVAPTIQKVLPGARLRPSQCATPANSPFIPTRISVPNVATNAEILALPRDANGVPQAPPISSKTQFAWDKPTIRPGSARGNVLLNTHTYPDGSAMGNKLLENLQVGGLIILRGDDGEELCYRVTKRDVIVAANGSFEYYEKDGPPQVALIVCSPPRLGPGNWKNRTIWYASPLNAAGELVTGSTV